MANLISSAKKDLKRRKTNRKRRRLKRTRAKQNRTSSRTQNVPKRPNSTVGVRNNSTNDSNVVDFKEVSNKKQPPNRTGTVSKKYLNPMLKAMENMTIVRPSDAELIRKAGGGSKGTVKKAREIACSNGWIEKKGQWKWTEKHLNRHGRKQA
jgi:U3 small nucleolar ribonucleoprotein component